MPCSSCGKHKADLTPKKSTLIPTISLLLCSDCKKARMEPRYIIILAGRSPGGYARVSEYVAFHRYIGPDILAKEILVVTKSNQT